MKATQSPFLNPEAEGDGVRAVVDRIQREPEGSTHERTFRVERADYAPEPKGFPLMDRAWDACVSLWDRLDQRGVLVPWHHAGLSTALCIAALLWTVVVGITEMPSQWAPPVLVVVFVFASIAGAKRNSLRSQS